MMYKPVLIGLLILTAVLPAACGASDLLMDQGQTSTPQAYRAAATVIATGTPIDAMDSSLPGPVQGTPPAASLDQQTPAGTPPAADPEPTAELCSDAGSGKSLSYHQALDIAVGSDCTAAGDLLPAHFCSPNTGAWWIALHVQKEGCNPVCVIDVNSHTAQVNWRCSGETPPTTEETAQLQQAADAGEQTGSDFGQFDEWHGIIYRQPHGALVIYRFLRDDGQWFDIGTNQGAIRQKFAGAAWNAAKVILSGELTAVPGSLNVQNLIQLNTRFSEARDLTVFAMASSSSQLATDDGGAYHAWSAVDGSMAQPWCEGVGGPGEGEWLQLDFAAPLHVTAIRLANGYQSGDYLYMLNNRVQSASILLDEKLLARWNLDDTRDWQTYTVAADGANGVLASSVRLVIEQATAGWEFDDTCIAEVEVWGIPAQ